MRFDEVEFKESDIEMIKAKIMELISEGNVELIGSMIDTIKFTDNELEQIKKKALELGMSGNEKILCMLLDKVLPDAN